ncbi:hypothetical protein LCGC14_2899170 [marine sediment metagenome]|uniref:Uncharacterized protein n=1 Tax=marine sediment metagenome TaxID=412755 RepID=A0A0F8XV07_9ZZZZ
MKHTLEPWYETDGAISAKWETGEEVQVALMSGSRWSQPDESKNKRMREESKANLSRVIACVNGCKNINPGAVSELLEALKELEALRKMPHPSGDLDAAVAYRQRERDAVALSKAAIAKAESH